MLDVLLSKGVFPTYSFPRNVVGFNIDSRDGQSLEQRPDRGLNIAISEYAPGKIIVVNKKTYTNPYIVVIQCEDHDSEVQAKAYLDQHAKRCVVKSKSAQKGKIELNLEIRLKEDNTDFINELADMPRVNSAVLVSYNGDYMG